MRMQQEQHHFGARVSRIGTTLVLGAALAVGFACRDNRSVDGKIDDSTTTAALAAKFMSDTEIDRYRIDIDTVDGVVTLRGAVSTSEQRKEAERIALDTKGVRSVVNNLEVDPTPRAASTTFDDAWITTMIGSKLALDPEVPQPKIDVDVRRGVVILSGTVESKAARDEAEELAWTVDGVTQVANEIKVAG